MQLKDFLAGEMARIDEALDRLTPPESAPPETIHRAMRYSLFAGGKRIRPILCMQGAAAVSGCLPAALAAGCAVEMIHTYSLIHDDLPALDNDDFRRGKPTCHKVFGEAMAILAGDALFTLAMQTLVHIDGLEAAAKVRLIDELAFASGTVEGMIGGQVTDIESERQTPTAQLLDNIHRAKTGALLRASVRMGGVCAGGDAAQIEALSKYGEHVGLAFQIVDDILDVE
jgi:geranylgeranyl diphosphate synthase type II